MKTDKLMRTDNAGRDIHLHDLRVTEHEAEVIRKRVRESGITIGAFIRNACMNHPVLYLDDVISELNQLTGKIDVLIYCCMKAEGLSENVLFAERLNEVLEELWNLVQKLRKDNYDTNDSLLKKEKEAAYEEEKNRL